jgi:sulfotransferase
MSNQIFFQSSLPRAGSTLSQNIMGQNPEFYVTPTSGVLELVYAARNNYTNSPEFKAQDQDLMKKGFLSFCRNGVEGFFHAITDKPYILDKSRGWGVH